MHDSIAGRPDWPRPRARIALDLGFITSRKQPPNLENLAKHYLDQLSATHDQGEEGHLYVDDRQVQLLHVSAHHGWDVDQPRYHPEVRVTARTASDAVAEMQDAARLPEPDHRFDLADLDLDDLHEGLRNAARLEGSTNPRLRRAAPQLRAITLQKAQDAILQTNDRWLDHLFWGVSRSLLGGSRTQHQLCEGPREAALKSAEADNVAMIRGVLLGQDANSIRLPALPTAAGQGALFREGVRDALVEFVGTRGVLFPLLVPTRLTVFVVQPEQPRDLDNILLDLLPIVDETMRPPQEQWLISALDDSGEPDEETGTHAAWRKAGLRRLRSVVEHGVWSCQVIELARSDADPPEGVLAAMLGHGENRRSTWEAASDANDELRR